MANPLEELFAAAASLDSNQQRIDESIEYIKQELARDGSACILALIGDFVVRATKSLSRLTDALVEGDHIDGNSDDRMEEMVVDDGFSDMTYVEYMEDKHAVLREMNAKIYETSIQIEASWKVSPHTPPKPSHRYPQHSDVLPPTPLSVQACWEAERNDIVPLPLANSRRAASSPPAPDMEFKYEMKSPGLEDDSQGIINEMIASLASRGKGEHTCPLGNRCRKGGLAPSGDLLVFKRNSAFRTHLEKHGRRYKCDIPNCKNRDGFARKDQLHRHQQETVAHGKGGT